MIFKEIRYLICDRLDIIVGPECYSNVEVNDSETDKFDYYEVIGIRAWSFAEDEGAVVISLKETANKHFENYLETCNYKDNFICEQAKGN